MAFVNGGWFSVVTLADNGGNTTTKTYQLDAQDIDDAALGHADIVAALTGVTDAEILSHYYYLKMVEDTPLLPASGVQIENLALLTLEIAGNPMKTATHTIPAPKQAIFMAASGASANVIDTSNAAVIAYRSLFQNAGPCFISDGEKVNVLRSGKRIHRASRNG